MFIRSLIASVLFHLLFGLLLQQINPEKQTPSPDTVLKIELNYLGERVHAMASPGSKKLNFLPAWSPMKGATQPPAGFSNEGTGNQVASDQFFDPQLYTEGASVSVGDNSDWEFLKALYMKIDSEVIFDSILAQYGHFGVAYFEFEVTDRGQLIQNSIQASAKDPILKVHSVRALRKALREPLPLNKKSQKIEQKIKIKFEYVQASSQWNWEKQNTFLKPVLLIRRATTEKPISQNMKDHLLSGGISYDPFSMAERWKKYHQRRHRIEGGLDLFQNYKSDPAYNL